MGKKFLRFGFPILAVVIVIFSIVRVAMMTDEERDSDTKKGPTGLALEVRDKFAESVFDTLGGKEAKLGLAYLVGMKDGLDKETQEMLRAVGLTHIVVASGTHLSIIVEFFKKRFGKISRFAGALYSLLFIVIFAALVGWTASITRAAIVSTLSIFGWYFGRKFGAWRIILYTMAITLLINPLFVIDLGWLLSFASFSGIMILNPLLVQFFYGQKKESAPGKIAEILLASVSANLMCIPILIYFFGSISTISLVANLLVLPTIPFAMGLTFLTGLVGFLPSFFVFDWLKFLLTKITTILLDYHLAVFETFSKQTSFILTVGKGDTRVFLLYVPILIPFIILAVRNMKRRHVAMLRVHSNPGKYLPFTTIRI